MTAFPAVYDNLSPLPIQGPLTAGQFFERRPAISGIQPTPRLGIGTAFMVGLDPAGPVETLHTAWREGFLYADTAPLYGDAEEILGIALRKWTGQRPVVATKTRRTTDLEVVRQRFISSQSNLGRIDLLAVHDVTPDYVAGVREETTGWVRGLLDEGVIAAAGLGGGGPEVQAAWLPSGVFRYVLTHLRLDAITLQGLRDTVPLAQENGASVIAASPMHRGLFGPRHDILCDSPPPWLHPIQVKRARAVKRMAQEWGIPLSQLAVRFQLSMPFVDLALTGAKSLQEWRDVQTAYGAGPLPAELYADMWRNALEGPEPMDGG